MDQMHEPVATVYYSCMYQQFIIFVLPTPCITIYSHCLALYSDMYSKEQHAACSSYMLLLRQEPGSSRVVFVKENWRKTKKVPGSHPSVNH